MITSISISNEYVRIVLGTASSSKVKIKKQITIKLPEGVMINGVITDESLLKRELNSAWENHHLPRKYVRLVVDGSTVFSKKIEVPRTNEQKTLVIIKEEFSDIEGYEDLIYDYSIIQNKNKNSGRTVLACAMEKSNIEAYLNIFKSIKVGISSIGYALDSQKKMSAIIKTVRQSTYILSILDSNSIVVYLYRKGVYTIHNRSRIMENRGTTESAQEISRIISSMIQFNKSEKTGDEITDIYFAGVADNEEKLCDIIYDNVGIKTKVIPDVKEVSFAEYREASGQRLSQYYYAIANLIKSDKEVNFLTRAKENIDLRNRDTYLIYSGVAIACVTAITMIGYLYLDGRNTRIQNEINKADIELMDPSMMEQESIRDNYAYMNNSLKTEIANIENVKNLVETYPELNLNLFTNISKAAGQKVDIISYDYSSVTDAFTLECSARDNTSIPEFIRNLQNTNLFLIVDYNSYALVDEDYRFTVNCVLKIPEVKEDVTFADEKEE